MPGEEEPVDSMVTTLFSVRFPSLVHVDNGGASSVDVDFVQSSICSTFCKVGKKMRGDRKKFRRARSTNWQF